MRGTDQHSGSLFSYVDLEARVPKGHPLRAIRAIANSALSELSSDFAALYAPLGRPSRARKGRMVLHHGGRRLQSHPATQAHGCGMTRSSQSDDHDLTTPLHRAADRSNPDHNQ